MTTKRDAEQPRLCGRCNGDGHEDCTECGGYDEPECEDCPRCNGDGHEECQECQGTGTDD